MAEERELTMANITNAEIAEIEIRDEVDGLRIWVNVDGVCRFRGYRIENLRINLNGKQTVTKWGKYFSTSESL